jgi:hypothetical protein
LRSDVIARSKTDTDAARPLNWIFRSRHAPHFGPFEAIVFLVYLALFAVTIAHHIPWVDEAQGWLVARDSSLLDLFNTRLRYEGSPGLWHLFLWILCRMHVSFTAMRWIASIVPAAGIFVFLRYSPFPAILRVVLPFSFYLGYQYAVISRNYIAAPLLIFVCAVLFAKPARNLVWLAIVLGLLGNLCVQGLVISAGFAAMIAIRLWRERKRGAGPIRIHRLVAASICLCAFWAVSVWSTRPASDDIYTPAWRATHLGKKTADASAPSAPAAHADQSAEQETEAAGKPEVHGTLKHMLGRFKYSVSYGLSNSWFLSLAAWCAVAVFLISRRNAFDLLPLVLLQALFEFVAARPWHLGTLLLALLAVLWIDWPTAGDSQAPAWRAILSLILLAIAAEQSLWTVRAMRTDLTGKYSGDRDAAEFLAGRIQGKTVAGFGYYSVGILPYFASNIFENQPKEAFWNFSKKVDVDAHVVETLEKQPDIIDVGFAVRPPDAIGGSAPVGLPQTFEPGIEREILATGLYRETHRFCGDAFSGHGYHEGLCQVILERSAHSGNS